MLIHIYVKANIQLLSQFKVIYLNLSQNNKVLGIIVVSGMTVLI